MSHGPVDLVVLRFDRADFEGEVLREIQKAVDAGTIELIDILLAVRLGQDPVRVVQIEELDEPALHRLEPVITDIGNLLTEEDAQRLTAQLAPDSAIALIAYEHRWMVGIADAIERAGGGVVSSERMPRAEIDQLVADLTAEIAAADRT